MKKIGLVLFLGLSVLFAGSDLGSITVTAGTKTAKILEESPIKMQVITSKDLEISHVKSADEALQYMPGLMLKDTIKDGSGVWIQGINSDRVLVLINGEPMTSSTGSTVDLTQINTGDIERIEIIKGAASALHGSQAMGGVINIITKKPEEGLHGNITLETGNYGDKGADDIGTKLLKTSTSYKTDKIAFGVNLDYRYDSGIKLEPQSVNYDLPSIDKVNLNGYIKFFGDINWYIKPRIYTEKTVKPYETFSPGIGYIQEEKKEDAKKYRLSTGMDFDTDGYRLKVSTFVEHYDDDSITDKLATSYKDQVRKAKIDMNQIEVQHDILSLNDHIVTSGINMKNETLKQQNLKTTASGTEDITEIGSDAKRDVLEIFVQDDWFISDNLELIPGVRYQDDSDFGSYIAPKVSLMYTPYNKNAQRLNMRASYGYGYKVPTLKERFYFFDHSMIGYQVLGNSELLPEKSKSLQLSTEWLDNNKGYSFALNLFRNDIKDLIEEIHNKELSDERALLIYQYSNIAEAYTQGFELEYSIDFLNYFNLNGGYTYLIGKDKQTDKYLTNRPKHQFKTNLKLDNKSYSGLISYIYESKSYTDKDNEKSSPKNMRVDVKLTRHVTKLFDLYAGVNNLLDIHKDPDDDYDKRTKKPKYIYFGMKYKF